MGTIRLKLEEAKEAIAEHLHIGTHFMDSPRTKSDIHFRISAARVTDPENPSVKAGFKFFKRGDIRDTAAFFNQMSFMEPVEGNTYNLEG
eukprot:336083-Heterocapsa_arctica.AAC.1